MFFSGQGSNWLKKYINRKQLEHLILSLTSESQLYPILRQGVKFLLSEEIDLDKFWTTNIKEAGKKVHI